LGQKGKMGMFDIVCKVAKGHVCKRKGRKKVKRIHVVVILFTT